MNILDLIIRTKIHNSNLKYDLAKASPSLLELSGSMLGRHFLPFSHQNHLGQNKSAPRPLITSTQNTQQQALSKNKSRMGRRTRSFSLYTTTQWHKKWLCTICGAKGRLEHALEASTRVFSLETYCHLIPQYGKKKALGVRKWKKKDWEGERVRRDERKLFKVVERQYFLCQCSKRRLVNIQVS